MCSTSYLIGYISSSMLKFLIVLAVTVGAANVKGKGNDVNDKAQNSDKVIMQMEKLENQINSELHATSYSLSQQANFLNGDYKKCYQELLTPYLNTVQKVTKSIKETIQSTRNGAHNNHDPQKSGQNPKKGSSNVNPLNLLKSQIENLNNTRINFEKSAYKCFKYE